MMDRQVATGSGADEAAPVSDAELISAWMDGELGAEEAAALLQRVEDEPALRQQWTWLHLVQDAVRSPEVAAMERLECVQRVEIVLQGEPVFKQRGRAGRFGGLRLMGMQGLALAAGVAAVAWIAVPLMRAPADARIALAPNAAGTVPVVTAVHGDAAAGRVVNAADPRGENLDYYLQAHSDLADGGLMSAAALIRASYAEER